MCLRACVSIDSHQKNRLRPKSIRVLVETTTATWEVVAAAAEVAVAVAVEQNVPSTQMDQVI